MTSVDALSDANSISILAHCDTWLLKPGLKRHCKNTLKAQTFFALGMHRQNKIQDLRFGSFDASGSPQRGAVRAGNKHDLTLYISPVQDGTDAEQSNARGSSEGAHLTSHAGIVVLNLVRSAPLSYLRSLVSEGRRTLGK